MATFSFQVQRGISVAVRLVEVDDAGYVAVNSQHFALKEGQTTELNGGFQPGPNKLKLVVQNKGAALPVGGRLPGGQWHGRFELYINGVLSGAYADSGNDGLGSKEHTVAEIEVLVAGEAEPPIDKPSTGGWPWPFS